MNEDPNQNVFSTIFEHSWIITFLAATWGVVLRALVGRYQNQAKDNRETLHSIQNTLHLMEGRIKYIEGRFKERDSKFNDTGPHSIFHDSP